MKSASKCSNPMNNQKFMDDMHLAMIYQLSVEDLKKIAYKHKIKLTLELLELIRRKFKS
jgi:hypothetical protein